MSALTPVMQQYLGIKKRHPEAILFFRLGDFYEMFFEDAETASRELEIVLTARDGGGGVRVPMCGVPVHAAEGYIGRLTDKGYRVAICEQVEDPKTARGLVRREVVRVVTPGTVMDSRLLGEKRNNFISSLVYSFGRSGLSLGLAAADASTGEFLVTQFEGEKSWRQALDELARLRPAECLVEGAQAAPSASQEPAASRLLDGLRGVEGYLRGVLGAAIVPLNPEECGYEAARSCLLDHFDTLSLAGFGIEGNREAVRAAGTLLGYLKQVQRDRPSQITSLRFYTAGDFMVLDSATRRNLELVARASDGQRQGSLLSVLDFTLTAMGGRMLRQQVEQPLVDRQAIISRLDAVEELVGDGFLRYDLREALKGVYDLERLASRVAARTAGARDLVSLRHSLERLPRLRQFLNGCRSSLLRSCLEDVERLEDTARIIRDAIVDDPPVNLNEGGIIRDGYSAEVDQLRQAGLAGKEWIATFEAAERERTGIKSLRVGYNRVFGYYIEVTNANKHLVPSEYQRRQTLANAERYVTPALKEKEELVLHAEERLQALEYNLYCSVRERVGQDVALIQKAARDVALVDMLLSLAEAAVRHGYVRPDVDDSDEIVITGGRHPVLEQVLGPGGFVPNDARMSSSGDRLLIVTGPNMAGKSTFARQVALIVIMAQIGSFVPAQSCRIGVVDRVFTRIGAADDLFSGESTFMVEMQEVANILHNATRRSLVILDEVGRGTSTFDGLSIAWAVSEYLHDQVGCKTIFTTHYHELTALEGLLPGARNLSVAVQEKGDDVIFLRRVIPGGADRSYGIQVARLAGLPHSVLRRAMEVLRDLEKTEETREARQAVQGRLIPAGPKSKRPSQQSLLPSWSQLQAIRELMEIDLFSLTPLAALNKLHELQILVREGSAESHACQQGAGS